MLRYVGGERGWFIEYTVCFLVPFGTFCAQRCMLWASRTSENADVCRERGVESVKSEAWARRRTARISAKNGA